MEKDPFTGKVIGCAIEVHRVLGPGLPINVNVQRLADGIDRFRLCPLCVLCALCGRERIRNSNERMHGTLILRASDPCVHPLLFPSFPILL